MKRKKRFCESKDIKRELKVYFLIFNLVIAIIAFSVLVSAPTPAVGASSDTGAKTQAVVSTVNPLVGLLSSLTGGNKKTQSAALTPTTGSGGVTNPPLENAKAEAIQATTSPQPESKIPPTAQVIEGRDYVLSKMDPNTLALIKMWAPDKYEKLMQESGQVYVVPKSSCTNPNDPNCKNNPVKTDTPPAVPASSPSVGGAISGYFDNLLGNLGQVAMGAGLGAVVGSLAGGKNGILWGTVSGASGVFTYQILRLMNFGGFKSGLIALGVAAAIFLLTYKKDNTKPIELQCLPWQAPVGGSDCEKCNSMAECSEYTCKSLGQACELINKGLKNQKCSWKNQYDTNSPTIEMIKVTQGHRFVPDKTIRPPATGVQILKTGGECIKAFTPLEFIFKTNEPSQCKIDYNLTAYSADAKTGLYDNMGYYVGGDSSFEYNHTETLSLPGPEAINKVANLSGVELKNDGTYTLYIRCQDANGNFNVNPFSVRFCVEKGPDSTPPEIVNVIIPSGSPIQFNRSSIAIEVYVNEPADCRWSYEDGRKYDLMEYSMSCSNQLWEMNNQETYTCKANLTGIESRKENVFYFRCKDKPYYPENERNSNTQSYRYVLIGTQPLNIIKSEPGIGDIVKGASDRVAVNLSVKTDNGYNNGESLCYYSITGKEKDYIEFSETGSNLHKQRQDLVPGNYSYYYKCVDLGGNAVYNSTKFTVESDTNMPSVIRVTKETGELKIVTDKESECGYSNKDCNFEVDEGIKMSTIDGISHYSDWSTNKNYYIRCKDKNNNQPDPNVCTIILKPVDLYERGTAIEL